MIDLKYGAARAAKLFVLVGAAALPGAAWSATCTWDGSNNSFASPTRWSCGRIPNAADVAVINAGTVTGATGTVAGLTLATGASLTIGSNLQLTTLTNNGTITVPANARLSGGSTLAVDGTGTINVSGTGALFNNVRATLGAGQTVQGSGTLLAGGGTLSNAGIIRTTSASTLVITPGGTVTGLLGAGFGTNGNAGLFNTGTIQAVSGAIELNSGMTENSATGVLAADGASLTMKFNVVAALAAGLNNLDNGVIKTGIYRSTGTGVLTLRSANSNSIIQIGGAGATDTVVTLSGAAASILTGSALLSGTSTIDSSLTTINTSGRLELLQGRGLAAGSRTLTNNGIVQLGGVSGGALGTITAGGITNSGQILGYGNIAAAIASTGSVLASNGTLAVRQISGAASGTAQSSAGATLDFGTIGTANSTAFKLVNNGSIALGTRTVTVTNDYTNAAFGTGNAFNGRANVTGTGVINATSATQTLSATGLSGSTLQLGAIRVGGSNATGLTITNNGNATILRGAIQNGSAPAVTIGTRDFVLAANGGAATSSIGISGATAGSFSQTVNIVNNFANVGAAALTVNAKVYAPAVATLGASSVAFGAARVGSTITRTVSVTNSATGGLIDTLVTSLAPPGGVTGTAPGVLAAGASGNASLTLAGSTAGTYSGNVTLGFLSRNPDLADLGLASQVVSYTGKIYAPAAALLGATSIAFGTVRQNSVATRQVSITNTGTGALVDTLVTSLGSGSPGVAVALPTALVSGQTGSAGFTLATATAGVVSGSTTLAFASHDADLADLALAGQAVGYTGTVTELAVAQLLKTGRGSFAGSGTRYTLDLGGFGQGTQVTATGLGALNAILQSAWSETLGGTFSGGGGGPFSFTGGSFAGLAGGASSAASRLTFAQAGLGAGTYTTTVYLDAFSRFFGLADFALTRLQVDVRATIFDVGIVPEPGVWLQMIAGFGTIGLMTRRRRGHRRRRVTA